MFCWCFDFDKFRYAKSISKKKSTHIHIALIKKLIGETLVKLMVYKKPDGFPFFCKKVKLR